MLSATFFSQDKRLHLASTNNPPLKRGETGDAVKLLQQALIDIGFRLPISTKKTGLPDGIYGAETEAAVMAFQQRHGLSKDGVTGKDTIGRLDAIVHAAEIRNEHIFNQHLRTCNAS